MNGLRAIVACGLMSVLAGSACSDWPPESKGGGAGGGGSSVSEGYCTGTPLGCQSLNAAQCEAMPGCSDNGQCSGSGITCGTERSYSSCESAADCYWSASCSGAPMGCFATTRAPCEGMAGCRWVARSGSGGSGGGGSSGTGGASNCQTLGSACVNATSCDCNLSCVQLCTSCNRICVKTCQSDSDCANAGGLGVKTPYCVGQSGSSAPKICGASR